MQMSQQPEFIRGNQKSYMRLSCDMGVLSSYEYQMCTYNALNSFLEFQQRSQNGDNYLYFEVSGMQSLDIFLQTQKLKRPFAVALFKGILKLCKELAEFALDIQRVIFAPKYIMVAGDGGEIKFAYSFQEQAGISAGLEQMLECCIEYLDYQDEALVTSLYSVYECLLDQGEHFSLAMEAEKLLEALTEIEVVEIVPDAAISVKTEAAQEHFLPKEEKQGKSSVFVKERHNLKKGLWALLLLDIALLFFWKPLTILKIFFCTATGCILFALSLHVMRQEKSRKNQPMQEALNQEYLEEYQDLIHNSDGSMEGTRVIAAGDSDGVLYNLQNFEPQYIYIGSERKIIGKDAQRVQVCIQHESVSRIHALVVKEGVNCVLEDLNSTNGTWVNGKQLEPRVPYILKQGDKVLLASLEYIFR